MKTIGTKTLYSAVIAVMMAVTALLTPSQALAECFTQYGGGETCIGDVELSIDKKIYNPDTKKYQDNIKRDDYTFEKGDEVKFKLVVKNTGDIEIRDIKLIDEMPSILEYIGGDGDDENDGRKVVFEEFDLKAGESKTFEFESEVVSSGIDPDEDYVCVSNVAKAKGERKDNGEKEDDVDYSNFCVEIKGKVLSKKKIGSLPKTGLFDPYVALAGTSAVGLVLIGYGLRKMSKDEE